MRIFKCPHCGKTSLIQQSRTVPKPPGTGALMVINDCTSSLALEDKQRRDAAIRAWLAKKPERGSCFGYSNLEQIVNPESVHGKARWAEMKRQKAAGIL